MIQFIVEIEEQQKAAFLKMMEAMEMADIVKDYHSIAGGYVKEKDTFQVPSLEESRKKPELSGQILAEAYRDLVD